MTIEELVVAAQKKAIALSPNEEWPGYTNYCKDISRNLIETMNKTHLYEYCGGSGGEMKPTGNRPPKMGSLRSSSAMTFNLLGNKDAVIHANPYNITDGIYNVKYEKQIYTLGCQGNPANLDAFLENSDEAVFCEMKMLEWLSNSHSPIDDKYTLKENYFSSKAYLVFSEIINNLKATHFYRYDVWQMVKHTLAIFNATFISAPDMNIDKYETDVAALGLKGKFKKITLANVVYQISDGQFPDLRTQHSYERIDQEELDDFNLFKITMLKDGKLQKLFKEECNAEFDIHFIPTHEFIKMIGKENDSFLTRYWKI